MKDLIGKTLQNGDYAVSFHGQKLVVGKVRLCKKQVALSLLYNGKVVHKYPNDCIKIPETDAATYVLLN